MRARSLMIDTCTITRATSPTFNTTTGVYSTSTTSIYSGACRVRGASVASITVTEAQAGDAEQRTTRPVLVVPHDADCDSQVGDTVTMTGGALTGRTFTVISRVESSTMTGLGFVIEAIHD